MRKSKNVNIEFEDGVKKVVVVKELSVSQIEGLMGQMDLKRFADPNTSLKDEITRFLGDSLIPIVSNLTLEECQKMYPSDIELVWNTIQEVNKSFFTLLVKLNIIEWLKGLLQVVGTSLISGTTSGQDAVPSLKQDISMPQSMDTPTS